MIGVFKFLTQLRAQHLAWKESSRLAAEFHAESRAEVARYASNGHSRECLRRNMELFGHANVRLGDGKMTHIQGHKLAA